jgi:hypothetical protein
MISFQHPASYLQWTAGQHFYVIIPSLSRLPWEAHPFTATTIPGHAGMGLGAGQVTFIVRVRDGATKRMKEAVDNERKAQGLGVDEECSIDVPAAIEGPYGQIRRMGIYDGVVIVAGELSSVLVSPSPFHICFKRFGMRKTANRILKRSKSSGWSSQGVGCHLLWFGHLLILSAPELDLANTICPCPYYPFYPQGLGPHPRHASLYPPRLHLSASDGRTPRQSKCHKRHLVSIPH